MQTKPFISLKLKVTFLMLVVSATIAMMGYIGYQGVLRATTESEFITQVELPQLKVLNEILSETITAITRSSSLLMDARIRETPLESTLSLFNEQIEEIQILLTALAFGSESEIFMKVKKGAYLNEWNTEFANEIGVLPPATPQIAHMSNEVSLYLSGYHTNILKVHHLNKMIAEATRAEEYDGANAYNRDALVYQDRATAYLDSVHPLLERIEDEMADEINQTVAELERVNNLLKKFMTLVPLVLTGFILLVGLGFAQIFIIKPMSTLLRTVEYISAGNHEKRVFSYNNDEIGKLASTIETMAEKLELSHNEIESIIAQKDQELTKAVTHVKEQNVVLSKIQRATINVLEDLRDEKNAVEMRVRERTKEIESEKIKLTQVTQNMISGALLFDANQEIAFINILAQNTLGLSVGETSSETIREAFFNYFGREKIIALYERCMNGKTFSVSEHEGGGRLYAIHFQTLHNQSEKTGDISGHFILFQDITDAKLLERSKSDLVAVASHQLRTPLTAIRGNVEMLIDQSYGGLNKEQQELLNDVEISTIRLIAMVNEMLDITKIEKGNLEMTVEPLNVKEIIDSVYQDLASYARRHEFEIRDTDVDSTVVIYGDKMRTRQIFQNLIDNAIKYSRHPGRLDISTNVKEGMVEITFTDNGIGIPKNELSKLFSRFYRASNTAKTASSGSGLGLYIIQEIAKQMGGQISVESVENESSKFIVTLPIHE